MGGGALKGRLIRRRSILCSAARYRLWSKRSMLPCLSLLGQLRGLWRRLGMMPPIGNCTPMLQCGGGVGGGSWPRRLLYAGSAADHYLVRPSAARAPTLSKPVKRGAEFARGQTVEVSPSIARLGRSGEPGNPRAPSGVRGLQRLPRRWGSARRWCGGIFRFRDRRALALAVRVGFLGSAPTLPTNPHPAV
jgi:hypothetical protein